MGMYKLPDIYRPWRIYNSSSIYCRLRGVHISSSLHIRGIAQNVRPWITNVFPVFIQYIRLCSKYKTTERILYRFVLDEVLFIKTIVFLHWKETIRQAKEIKKNPIIWLGREHYHHRLRPRKQCIRKYRPFPGQQWHIDLAYILSCGALREYGALSMCIEEEEMYSLSCFHERAYIEIG